MTTARQSPAERTVHAPGRERDLGRSVAPRGAPAFDWDTVRPVGPGEVWTVFCAGLVVGFFATLVCLAKGYLLLYGDAVAHLAIARRVLDARWPGLGQLGGVWLPLPHVLMMPFVQKMAWWQSGLGGAPMSVVSYAAAAAGLWKLARRMVPARWALVAMAFFALNANLLFLASTAMTEVLFLALLVWAAVACVECVAAGEVGAGGRLTALDDGIPPFRKGRERIGHPALGGRAGSGAARRWMLAAGLLVLAMVLTRYDGWIVGAVMWCGLAVHFVRERRAGRAWVPGWVFAVFTVLCVAGPLLWFWYNAHFEGDWLDFMRGPYSAAAIERKTAPVGQHYRGWHNVGWALLFYWRTAVVDSAWWEAGWVVGLGAVVGLGLSWRGVCGRKGSSPVAPPGSVAGPSTPLRSAQDDRVGGQATGSGPTKWGAVLLWVPLPFYVYSVAYGSVPIFIPQLWPHSYYNARYGMEMLPAFALYAAVALAAVDAWLRGRADGASRVAVRLLQPVIMLACVGNSLAMMYRVPLVLKEGMVNATTRVAFEHELAAALQMMPPEAPVMMYTSAHVGAVQVAGRTLRSMVSEMDNDAWQKALRDPAGNAEFVIAIAGDPVDAAVRAHPQGLVELEVVCTTGQPCARVFRKTMSRD